MARILERVLGAHGAGAGERPGRRALALGGVALALAALPVATVRRPPILDLPQLLLQVDQAGAALADPGGPLRMRWESPNKIAYPLLAAARSLGGDLWGPRAALFAVQAVWLGALFALARSRDREPESALVASLFLWSGTFYGGFLHFLLGFAAFALAVPELTRAPARRSAARIALRSLGLAALLYFAHALWLALGLLLGVALLIARRAPAREGWARAAGAAPVVLLAVLWYPSLARGGWTPVLVPAAPLTESLSSAPRAASFVLGGIRGPLEPVVLLLVLIWLAAGAWGARRRDGAIDRVLLAIGAALAIAAPTLPEVVGETTLFGRRWGWVAAVCLVLAVPPPPLPRGVRAALAALLVATLLVPTARVWRAYDREAAGLDTVLEGIEPEQRVLGLDLLRAVPGLWVPPFPHAAAWAALERRASIGYTFAESPSSLVVHRELPIDRGWTRWLHNRPDRLERRDLVHFDHLLVVAREAEKELLLRRFGLRVEVAAPPWYLIAGRRARGPAP